MPKVLISLPEEELRGVDRAAHAAGETRSAFIRRIARAALEGRPQRPFDDPEQRRIFEAVLQRAERRGKMTTAQALAARNKGRR